MKIPSFETKYAPGDIVIITWQDDYPELAMVDGIANIHVLDKDAKPTVDYTIKSPIYSRLHHNNPNKIYEGDRTEDGILCKFEDICNDKEILEMLKKAFNEEGIEIDEWKEKREAKNE